MACIPSVQNSVRPPNFDVTWPSLPASNGPIEVNPQTGFIQADPQGSLASGPSYTAGVGARIPINAGCCSLTASVELDDIDYAVSTFSTPGLGYASASATVGLIIISTDWGSLAPLVSGDRQTLYDAHFLENSEAQVRRSLSATLTAPRPLDRVTNWQLVVYVVAQVAAGGWASGAAKVSTTVRSIQYQPSFVG